MRRTLVALTLVALALLAVGVGALAAYAASLPRTPEDALARYLESVMRGDESAALAAWAPSTARISGAPEALEARRGLVTRDLVATRPLAYRVVSVEWWNTCCMPGVLPAADHAGLARFRVTLDLASGTRELTLDVFKQPECCGHDPLDFRPRFWAVRDAYTPSRLPLAFPRVWDAAARDSRGVPYPSEP